MTTDLFARHALIASDWAENVRFSVDETGSITHLEEVRSPTVPRSSMDPSFPGCLTSIATPFSGAMAGLTERAGPDGDDF